MPKTIAAPISGIAAPPANEPCANAGKSVQSKQAASKNVSITPRALQKKVGEAASEGMQAA
jgi:hypothetical protein